MSMAMDELQQRIEKLPEWARNYIRNLESSVEGLRHDLHRIDYADGPIYWKYIGLNDYVGIPERAHIYFKVDGGIVALSLSRIKKGKIKVRALQGAIKIRPDTTNAIEISAEPW